MKAVFLALIIFFAAGSLLAQTEADNYVVVIGAFTTQENADRFVKTATQYKVTPKAELNKIRGLYYVYVMQSADKSAAAVEASRLREQTPMTDTWVFNGNLGEIVVKKPEPEPVVVVQEPVLTPAPVEIKVIATDPPPEPVKTEEDKIKEAVASKTTTWTKGHMETLDYIFFYRDAAILRPESKHEIDRLVQMMQSHPELRIMIHGHTNGNDKGRIIKLGEGSKDFFSLDNTVEDYGSAVKLSELRANTIKDYLVVNGINAKRMSIKAWGGKKPLYAVDDEKAEANVRVEVEVLKKE